MHHKTPPTLEQDNSGEIEEREMKDMFCKLCRIVTREKEKLLLERTRAESEVYLEDCDQGKGEAPAREVQG